MICLSFKATCMHLCVTIDIFARSRQPRWLLASLKQCSLVTTLEHSSTPSEAPRNAALSPKCLSLFEPLSVFYSVSLCWHNYTQLNVFAFVKKYCAFSQYQGIKIIQCNSGSPICLNLPHILQRLLLQRHSSTQTYNNSEYVWQIQADRGITTAL